MSNLKLQITNNESSQQPGKSYFGLRHIQFCLLFFTIILIYGHRTILSVAIIAMTETTPPDPNIPTYPNWTNTDTILSSLFWGYIIPQIGAGQLGEMFGPKWFLVGSTIIGSVCNILIPLMAASFGSTGVIICRFTQGLSQGFLFPSVHNLISRWSPLSERSRVSAFVYSGTSLGVVFSMVFTGAVCDTTWGWPSVFYLYGSAGIVWAAVFAVFGSNSPNVHPRISAEEKLYIEIENSVSYNQKKIPTPWKSILTSLPVWSLLIVGFAHSWGYFTLMTEIPTYMSDIMNFDMESNSKISALPYIATFFLCMSGGPIADKLISKKFLTVGGTRKFFNCIATMVPAITLFTLGFIDGSQSTVATVLLILAVGATGLNYSGSTANVIDLAPNHVGTLFGIINGTSNIAAILGPLSVQFLGNDKKDQILWRKVFWLASGIYIVGNIIYMIFSTGEVQAWNDADQTKDGAESESNKEETIKENV